MKLTEVEILPKTIHAMSRNYLPKYLRIERHRLKNQQERDQEKLLLLEKQT